MREDRRRLPSRATVQERFCMGKIIDVGMDAIAIANAGSNDLDLARARAHGLDPGLGLTHVLARAATRQTV